jgi:predicted transcriptional regulator
MQTDPKYLAALADRLENLFVNLEGAPRGASYEATKAWLDSTLNEAHQIATALRQHAEELTTALRAAQYALNDIPNRKLRGDGYQGMRCTYDVAALIDRTIGAWKP